MGHDSKQLINDEPQRIEDASRLHASISVRLEELAGKPKRTMGKMLSSRLSAHGRALSLYLPRTLFLAVRKYMVVIACALRGWRSHTVDALAHAGTARQLPWSRRRPKDSHASRVNHPESAASKKLKCQPELVHLVKALPSHDAIRQA
jgi:hypothetical protein